MQMLTIVNNYMIKCKMKWKKNGTDQCTCTKALSGESTANYGLCKLVIIRFMKTKLNQLEQCIDIWQNCKQGATVQLVSTLSVYNNKRNFRGCLCDLET